MSALVAVKLGSKGFAALLAAGWRTHHVRGETAWLECVRAPETLREQLEQSLEEA